MGWDFDEKCLQAITPEIGRPDKIVAGDVEITFRHLPIFSLPYSGLQAGHQQPRQFHLQVPVPV